MTTDTKQKEKISELQRMIIDQAEMICNQGSSNFAVDSLTTIMTKNAAQFYRLADDNNIPVRDRAIVASKLLEAYNSYEERRGCSPIKQSVCPF